MLTVSSNIEDDEEKMKVERMILNAQAVLTASPSIQRKTLVVKRPGVTDMILYV